MGFFATTIVQAGVFFQDEYTPEIIKAAFQGGEPDAYIVIDSATGQVLAEKNANEQRFPASITKILTLGLALENYPDYEMAKGNLVELSRTAVTMPSQRAANVALIPDEVVLFEDLLQATYIRSANDAANGIAEYIAGSIEGFADKMNAKTVSLGLNNSHFMNPSGLPDAEHYTSAYDMAQIMRWALTVPGARELFASTNYAMEPTNKQISERVWSTNNMMLQPQSGKYYEGVTASKTGHTDDAMFTMVTTARKGDTELICVVMKCTYNDLKYTSTAALFDYCFDNYTRTAYPASLLGIKKVPVFGGGENALGEITVCAGEQTSFLLHNSLTLNDISVEMQIPEKYIIGQAFAPSAVFSIISGNGAQQGTLFSAPLSWTGLDAVLAANTAGSWNAAVAKFPMMPWVIFAVVTGLIFVIVSRMAYVRRKRLKRRRARIVAARSQVPIRIAPRPQPLQNQYEIRPSGVRRPVVKASPHAGQRQVYTSKKRRVH